MQSFVFVACLLASLALATPAHERRCFTGTPACGGLTPYGPPLSPYGFPPLPYGPIGGVSQQRQSHAENSQQSSSYQSGGGFGGLPFAAGGLNGCPGIGGPCGMGGGFPMGGPIGGSMTSYQSSSSSSSSYSYTSVSNAFYGLGSQIASIRAMMASGSFSQSMAYSQMSRLATQMQLALSQGQGCGSCFGPGSNLIGSMSNVFSEFTSMMSSMQSMFGPQYPQVCQPFSQLGGHFQSFFRSVSKSGMSVTSIVPPQLGPVLAPAIPAMGNMLGFK